jgi:hypothetical protein
MNEFFDRLGKMNPLVWVVFIVAAILGYGAKKLVDLMKIPEDKRLKVIVWMKSGALLLAVLGFVFILTT